MDFCFGRICVDTPEFKVDDFGVMPCELHPIRRLYGAVPGKTGGAQMTTISRDDEWAMVMAGAAMAQYNQAMLWSGNPATNNSAGLGYLEYKGLDLLVNTGYGDVHTGAECDALDSVVLDFNNQYICADGNDPDIYRLLVAILRTIHYRAQTGLNVQLQPRDMVIVSAPEIIDCLIDCIACTYYPCVAGAGSDKIQINAERAAAFRDRMVAQQVIHIDGQDYPYIKDPWVTKITGLAFGDETCADIFVLVRQAGALEVLYGEFQDMSKAPGNRMFGRDTSDHVWWTDGGRFLNTVEFLKWCVQASVLMSPRVILKAPWLQGRITNVCCRSILHYPDPDPTSPYFVDGGHGSPMGKSLYDMCADEDLTPV